MFMWVLFALAVVCGVLFARSWRDMPYIGWGNYVGLFFVGFLLTIAVVGLMVMFGLLFLYLGDYTCL